MVFGVFDGIHPGHRSLFAQARALGDHLVAVTTHDHVVRRLKGHEPWRPAPERLAALRAEPLVDEAVLGDAEPGSWQVLERLRPDVVALGYDQQALEASLSSFLESHGLGSQVQVRVLEAHEPERWKSSLLHPLPRQR